MTKSESNTYWPFGGKEWDSFGVNDQPLSESLPIPKENEVLAKVDAYTICASDVKMVQMGNDYPLFKDRDFNKSPARLGHELSLTVAASGKNRIAEWPIGMRFGVQPDVYLAGERYCIGVNVPGGMAEYLLLGTEVFDSDKGCCAFPVSEKFSAAAIAQTEPVACVEAAFVKHTRNSFSPKDQLFIWIDETAQKQFKLDFPSPVKSIQVCDPEKRLGKNVDLANQQLPPIEVFSLPDKSFDGVIVLGNPSEQRMTELTELIAPNGIFAWLPNEEPFLYTDVDIAKIHYNKINLTGAMTGILSDALNSKNKRYDYKPQGTLIISGGGGAMGRIHVMRALQHEAPPKRIIVTNLGEERLSSLRKTFASLAEEKDIELVTLSIKNTAYKKELRALVGEEGASDIVICAPGISPVNDVVEFLGEEGLLVLFAGTSYGQFGKLPLGMVAAWKVTITGSSGSTVMDQIRVIEKMEKNLLDPNINIAAIAGLYAGKDGIKAVRDGIFAGKVIVFPHLPDLPLTDLRDLQKISSDLALKVGEEGWSKSAEELLFEIYTKGEQ